jgi:hypothetical protein
MFGEEVVIDGVRQPRFTWISESNQTPAPVSGRQ